MPQPGSRLLDAMNEFAVSRVDGEFLHCFSIDGGLQECHTDSRVGKRDDFFLHGLSRRLGSDSFTLKLEFCSLRSFDTSLV